VLTARIALVHLVCLSSIRGNNPIVTSRLR
jgi:hypothetical protein